MTGVIEEAVETGATVLAPEAAIPAKAARWLLSDGWRLAWIVAMIAVGVQHVRINGLYLRPHIGAIGITLVDHPGLKPQLDTANSTIAARDKQITAMLAAQRTALDAQIAANHQPAADSRATARQANAQDKQNRPAILAAADAYRISHPVTACLRRTGPAPASGGDTGQAGVPGTDQPASGGSGQNLSPGMVAISRADFDGYNRNTADLDTLRAGIAPLIVKGSVRIEN